MSHGNRRILPGFKLSLGISIAYLALMVFLPLGACLFKTATLGWTDFFAAVWTPRARAAYLVTVGTSLCAGAIDVVLGLLLAWVLVRYEFPGKRLMDSLIDLPFALPTAVAGIVYAALYVKNGWLGQFLVPLGIHAVHTRLSIVLVLSFIGLPFVVRTLQPVLESFDADVEEAAASLGANRLQVFVRILLPGLVPAMWTGFALTIARSLGEFGSVVFISGNIRFKTEIAPVMIAERLEEFAYAEATAIASVLLLMSFLMLILINFLEWRSRHYAR